MATNIISVSVPLELAQFLEENDGISPSKLLQTKLYELKNYNVNVSTQIKGLEHRNGKLAQKLQRILTWCEQNKVIIPDNVLD